MCLEKDSSPAAPELASGPALPPEDRICLGCDHIWVVGLALALTLAQPSLFPRVDMLAGFLLLGVDIVTG
jgi:hypothetical protein